MELFIYCLTNTAEREGFEPSVQLPVQRVSRPSRSTTPASFLLCDKFINKYLETGYLGVLFFIKLF